MRLLTRRRARSQVPGQQWEWLGDAKASVLIAGHSHREAYRSAVAEGRTPAGTRVAVLSPEGPFDPSKPPELDDTYWRAACSARGRVLVVVWNGNQHNAHFMLEIGAPLRLYDCGEVGQVVPVSTFSAFWEGSFDGIEAVASSRAEHVVVVGTPPPNPDEKIRAALPHSVYFVQALAAAGESLETVPITPAAVRVGLWKILQADLEEWAARIDAVFVPVPDIARTADGCLRSEYAAKDATHANGAFGALMLGEIEKAVMNGSPRGRTSP
jgi:hypothetical protein